MKIMNLKERNEDAVSPVIGVMLMLVVTIVIAAVVAAFAGGLGSDVEMAPTAALDIDVYADGTVKIESLSGESLIKSDITVKVGEYSAALGSSGTLSPGSTTTVQLKNGDVNAEYNTGDFVTVTILANGKHVVAKKDVIVKA
ncbi:type IV pilin N-terminal domain-containing protein [Methanocorpusculum sp.]|nr:type IV pilin N-terminal domain-containing protein [Methanocorpusculum sp.]